MAAAFPRATRAYLDKHAQLRGLERREAVRAQGVLRFETDSAAQTDLSIPAGTVCVTAKQVRFETLEDVVLQAGDCGLWCVQAVAGERGQRGGRDHPGHGSGPGRREPVHQPRSLYRRAGGGDGRGAAGAGAGDLPENA